jgi:hypothetical protein
MSVKKKKPEVCGREKRWRLGVTNGQKQREEHCEPPPSAARPVCTHCAYPHPLQHSFRVTSRSRACDVLPFHCIPRVCEEATVSRWATA